MKVRCPNCGAVTEYSPDNQFRPFCSERCSIIDLGAWAEEKYRVPVQKIEEIDAEHADDENQPSDDDSRH
jgi:uncharacterized protein